MVGKEAQEGKSPQIILARLGEQFGFHPNLDGSRESRRFGVVIDSAPFRIEDYCTGNVIIAEDRDFDTTSTITRILTPEGPVQASLTYVLSDGKKILTNGTFPLTIRMDAQIPFSEREHVSLNFFYDNQEYIGRYDLESRIKDEWKVEVGRWKPLGESHEFTLYFPSEVGIFDKMRFSVTRSA